MADHSKTVCETHEHVISQCRCPGERLPEGGFAPKAIRLVPCNDWCPDYEKGK